MRQFDEMLRRGLMEANLAQYETVLEKLPDWEIDFSPKYRRERMRLLELGEAAGAAHVETGSPDRGLRGTGVHGGPGGADGGESHGAGGGDEMVPGDL